MAGALAALGRRLRRAREARGLSPTTLADRLRLGVEQLEALESADRERLPEPVFVIAQARRVAAALRLDITPELQALRLSGELQPRRRPGELVLPRPLPSAALAAASEAAGAPAGALPLRRVRQANRFRVTGRPGLLATAALLSLLALWAGWRLRGSTAAGGDPPRRQAGAVERGSLQPASAAAPSGRPGSDAVATGMVALASREPSWVEVRRSDGAMLFRGLLRGSRLFRLEPGLEVLAARPDLVSSRIGSEPARILGEISEVRWRSLAPGR